MCGVQAADVADRKLTDSSGEASLPEEQGSIRELSSGEHRLTGAEDEIFCSTPTAPHISSCLHPFLLDV
ncbi:MAG TPA: hypothetical protein VFW58_09500, partial [Trichococcus sp.]|nr:hypothetical protein [Trichococcus sp.]